LNLPLLYRPGTIGRHKALRVQRIGHVFGHRIDPPAHPARLSGVRLYLIHLKLADKNKPRTLATVKLSAELGGGTFTGKRLVL
jgi:hypothetical protein